MTVSDVFDVFTVDPFNGRVVTARHRRLSGRRAALVDGVPRDFGSGVRLADRRI